MSKKILVIEDEKPLAQAINLKLSHEGFEVSIAQDGEEGLELIKQSKPDLVLMDLIMPNLDGFGLLEKLREEKIETKVIVLSNLGQEEDIERTKQLGAIDFFVKADFALSDLVEVVKKYTQ